MQTQCSDPSVLRRAFIATAAAIDLRIDADYLTSHVEHGSASVAGVDRGVRQLGVSVGKALCQLVWVGYEHHKSAEAYLMLARHKYRSGDFEVNLAVFT